MSPTLGKASKVIDEVAVELSAIASAIRNAPKKEKQALSPAGGAAISISGILPTEIFQGLSFQAGALTSRGSIQ